MRISLVAVSALVATVALGPRAHAQATEPAALEEIVVTSQRVEENLQRAALPVSALSGEAVSQAGATHVQDLTAVVPSLQVAAAAGPYPLLYLRGVGNFNGNALSDAAIAVNLDGVVLARPSGVGGHFYDLERVEVLKGPQGTLYGRNATGGALNLITRKPARDFEGDAGLDVGNEGLVKFEGAINVPLGDTVAARVAAQIVDHDGYFSDDTDDEKSQAGRLLLNFTPSDAVSLLVSGDYYHMGGKGVGATILDPAGGFTAAGARAGATSDPINAIYSQTLIFTAGDFYGPLLEKALFVPTPVRLTQDNTYWGASATLDWHTNAGTLTVIPAYRHADIDYTSVAPSFLIDQKETDKQTSIEMRFASSTDRTVSYLLGAYYLDEDIESTPTYDQQYNASAQDYNPTTKSYAGFGRLGFKLSDAFRLTAGLRYTHDDKDIKGTLNAAQVLCPGVFIPPPAGPQFCFGGVGQVTIPSAPIVLDTSKTWSETTWRAGAEWDVAPQSLLYASVETGFKAGGFFFSHDDPTYDPEKITAYTLGSKNRFLDERLQLNAEAFYWKYHDQQISHLGRDSTGTVIFPTENVGKATMKGVELELQFLATANTLLAADVQYLDAEYDEFVYNLPNFGPPPGTSCPFIGAAPPTPFVVDCSGKTPPQSPEWTLNLGIQQKLPLGNGGRFVFDVHTHYQSDTLTGLEFLDLEVQDAYWMSGAAIAYEAPSHWTLSGYIENIEDEDVMQSTFPNPLAGATLTAATLRPPRTYGIRFGVNF